MNNMGVEMLSMKTAKEMRKIADVINTEKEIVNDILSQCEKAAKGGSYSLLFNDYVVKNQVAYDNAVAYIKSLGYEVYSLCVVDYSCTLATLEVNW